LTERGTEDFFEDVANWRREGSSIVRSLKFADFAEAMRFVNKVAEQAEEVNHHPDIAVRWNQVELSLTTHSKGGLTAADFSLARKIEKMLDY
jgi:4a-hydroxytetrahydrobiopterin dehydratase